MDIDRLGHKYKIVHAASLHGNKDVYRCIEKSGDTGRAVTVFRLRSCGGDLLKYLPRLQENKSFTDFIEYFIHEKDICIAVAPAQGESLKKRLLQESIGLEERAKLGALIIARLIQKEIPYYFACDGLQEENVKVTADLEVYFEYDLRDIWNAGNYGIKDVNGAVLKWIRLLFETEIKQRRSKKLQKLCYNLERKKLANYIAVYQEYMEICEELQSLPEADAPKDTFKGFFVKGVNIAAVLFLAAAITLSALYFNYRREKDMETGNIFEAIGTRQLEGNE